MWEKLEIISKIIAALLIPTFLGVLSMQLSAESKKLDVETKLIEIATNILDKDVVNQTEDSKKLRRWAVDVINSYSKIKMPEDVQSALVNNVPLPVAASTHAETTWAVVFGADRTLASAQHEIKVTAKKAGIDNAEILLRGGFYRSVVIFVNKQDAEEARERLKPLSSGSYIVDLNQWCQSITDQKDHRTCVTK